MRAFGGSRLAKFMELAAVTRPLKQLSAVIPFWFKSPRQPPPPPLKSRDEAAAIALEILEISLASKARPVRRFYGCANVMALGKLNEPQTASQAISSRAASALKLSHELFANPHREFFAKFDP